MSRGNGKQTGYSVETVQGVERKVIVVNLKVYEHRNGALYSKLLPLSGDRAETGLLALGKYYGIVVDVSHDARKGDPIKAINKAADAVGKLSADKRAGAMVSMLEKSGVSMADLQAYLAGQAKQ
jgi:hypothetical protein